MSSFLYFSLFFYAFFDLQHICITSSRRGCQGTAKLLKKSFVGPVACWVPWSFANAQVPEAKCWISASWKCKISGWKGTSVDGSSDDEYGTWKHMAYRHIAFILWAREIAHSSHSAYLFSEVKWCQNMSNNLNLFLPDSFSDLFGYVASPSRLSVEVWSLDPASSSSLIRALKLVTSLPTAMQICL